MKNLWSLLFVCLFLFYLPAALYGKCTSKSFNVIDYGDDIEAFHRLVSDVNRNGGGQVVFPQNWVYELSSEDDYSCGHSARAQESSIVMWFQNCSKVSINLNGSTIKLRDNHSTKYVLFFFSDCKQFSIKNGTLTGDANGHDYSPVVYKGKIENTSHQWGHGIYAEGSKGTISNMSINRMTGDGVYLCSHKGKQSIIHAIIKIDNCEISYCRRNGITAASSKSLIINGTSIHHIGSYDNIQGASPQAGLDLEYEDHVKDVGTIEINDCHFYECTEKTVSSSNSNPPIVKKFIVSNSYFEGSYFQITRLKSSGEKKVKDCHFVGTPINCGDAVMENCTFEMGTKIHYVHGTTFRNCAFSGQLAESDSKYGGCFAGNNYTPATFINCSFKDVRGKNDNSVYQGFSGYTFKLLADFVDCEFSNCSFSQGGAGAESNYTFKGCTLINGCTIYNRSDKKVAFSKSKLYNVASYVNQKGQFSFDDCEIVQDDDKVQFPLIYFGQHQVKNSVIRNSLEITPAMKSRGVKKALIEEIK